MKEKKERSKHATGKFARVMSEYKHGTLKSSSGDKVTSPAQAKAIAASEAGISKKGKK